MCVVLSSGLKKKQLYPCGSCASERGTAIRRLFCAVSRGVNEFGKLFDHDDIERSSCAEGYTVKLQKNNSVSFHGTIRYIMRV